MSALSPNYKTTWNAFAYNDRIANEHHGKVDRMLRSKDGLRDVQQKANSSSAFKGNERSKEVRSVDDKLGCGEPQHKQGNKDKNFVALSH